MSTNTAVMVNIQKGYAYAEETSQRRRTCMNPKTTVSWSEEDEKHCQSLVDDCRRGKVFWMTKHPGFGQKENGNSGKQAAQLASQVASGDMIEPSIFGFGIPQNLFVQKHSLSPRQQIIKDSGFDTTLLFETYTSSLCNI